MKKLNKKQVIAICMFVLSLIGLVYYSTPFISNWYDEYKDEQTLKKVKDVSVNISVDERLQNAPDVNKIKQELNPDITGWIYIPNTSIDEPVVQGVNNWDYLYYNFDGTPNGYGSLFLDVKVNKDMTNMLSFIFGHESDKDLKFTHLHKFLDEEFLNQNKYVYYFSENGKRYTYEVLGIQYIESVNKLYIKENLQRNDEDFEYLKSTLQTFDNIDQSKVSTLTKDDSILVLATCVDSVDSGHRYFVVTKLIEIKGL